MKNLMRRARLDWPQSYEAATLIFNGLILAAFLYVVWHAVVLFGEAWSVFAAWLATLTAR